MSKINLNVKEIVTVLWRTLVIVLLTANLIIATNLDNEIAESTAVTISYIENVDKKIDELKIQPEIPDTDNKEYQASCPAESNILDDPNRVVRFFEAIDPYIEAKPYRLNLLIALLVGNRDRASNYLLEEYSTGFPIR